MRNGGRRAPVLRRRRRVVRILRSPGRPSILLDDVRLHAHRTSLSSSRFPCSLLKSIDNSTQLQVNIHANYFIVSTVFGRRSPSAGRLVCGAFNFFFSSSLFRPVSASAWLNHTHVRSRRRHVPGRHLLRNMSVMYDVFMPPP